MDAVHVVAAAVAVGDPVGFSDVLGWWFVESVEHHNDQVTLRIAPIGPGETMSRTVGVDEVVRRGDPSAVHRPEEFVGLTLTEARALAAALGWRLVGPGDVRWGGGVIDNCRLQVWTDNGATVVRAAFF